MVEGVEEVELGALFLGGEVLVADMFDELFELGMFGIDVGALVDAGEEAALPVLGFLDGVTAGAHGDEAGEVLVFGAEAVGDPGSEAGSGEAGFSAIHEEEGGFVVGDIGVHGADDGEVIGAFADVGEEFTDLEAGLAVALEGEGGTEGGAGFAFCFEVEREFLAVPAGEFRFGVEGIDVGDAAIGEDMDDAFGFGWKVGGFGGEGGGWAGGESGGIGEEAEAEGSETEAAALEELAAGEEGVFEPGAVVGWIHAGFAVAGWCWQRGLERCLKMV